MTAPEAVLPGDGPVRWGFLGAGMIATNALGPATHTAAGAVLHAAGARDVERARALRPARAYGSYQEVLDDPEVEAVYVALANDAHLPWTLAALEAGKAVLCEKPLGLDAAEVDRMARASEAAGLPVVEASWYRWHPRVRLAQEVLRSGRVGAVRHVSAGFTFAGVAAENYRMDPTKGGGALYDVGCYAVSACLWAVGQGLPESVVARARLAPTGVDLVTEALLEWPDGVTAEVRAGIDEAGRQWLVATTEDGEVELRDAPYTSWATDDTELWVSDGTATERVPVPGVDPYRLMVEEVSSVLRGGPGWLLGLAESAATASVLDACFASAAAGGAPVAPSRTGVAGSWA